MGTVSIILAVYCMYCMYSPIHRHCANSVVYIELVGHFHYVLSTVECRFNAVQYNNIFHSPLHWPTQNINQISYSQKTLHILPSQASYRVSIVRIWEKIDCVIRALHCIYWFWFIWFWCHSYNHHGTRLSMVWMFPCWPYLIKLLSKPILIVI